MWNSPPRQTYQVTVPMYQAWTYGDYVLRESRSADVPVIAALEWSCQSHPWQLERVEAFLTVPHEGHEQFGLMASLELRPVGYAILVLRESNVAAQKFFFECGFRAGRIAGPLKGWFGAEDAVAMRRPVFSQSRQVMS